MAVEIKMYCTDRMGVRLASKTIIGPSFAATLPAREKLMAEWFERYKEHSGARPYIFSSTKSTE